MEFCPKPYKGVSCRHTNILSVLVSLQIMLIFEVQFPMRPDPIEHMQHGVKTKSVMLLTQPPLTHRTFAGADQHLCFLLWHTCGVLHDCRLARAGRTACSGTRSTGVRR